MNSQAKVRRGLLVSSIFFLITIISLSMITNPPEGTDLIEVKGPETPELETSAWWNITTYSINIDGNWTDTNSTYSWCNGSGTLNAPFIIENVILNATRANSCISIANTNEYFIIRNCTLFNSTTTGNTGGIVLNNVTNGNITDTEIYSCNYGMLINGTENCTINDVYIHANTNDSVYLLNTNLTLLTDIDCYNNDGHGVYFEDSDNNTVSYSAIRNNDLYGVYLDENSSLNWVYENYVGYNLYDMRLEAITGYEGLYNVCYYILDYGQNNVIKNNDEVGACTPSPIYGTLPPQEPVDVVLIIIITLIAITVVISLLVLFKKFTKKMVDVLDSREKESAPAKPKETESKESKPPEPTE